MGCSGGMKKTHCRIRRALKWSVAVALGLGPIQAESQTRPAPPSAWNQSAAADYLDGRQRWWSTWDGSDRDHDTSCVSCHTTLPYMLARPALQDALNESGPTAVENAVLTGVSKRVRLWNEVEPYYPDQTVGLPKTSESRGTEAVLNALVLASRDAHAGSLRSDSRKAFENLWRLQFTRGDETGAWAWLNFGLAPWESDGSAYFGAALAAIAVGIAPGGYADSPDIQEPLALLRSYLREDLQSRSPYDRVFGLWAATELPGLLTVEQGESVLGLLEELQNPDGGWSLSSLGPWERQDGSAPVRVSDGYATGLVAYVLLRAGNSREQPNVSRALAWLVNSQDAAGHWPANSLNKERDPTSDRGRFMADAATAFAVLALTEADGPGE